MVLLSLIILACLVPFWYSVGQGCAFLKLPSITGYIVGGILCGPHVAAILRQPHLTDVAFIEHACLSYIALLAGAELHLGGIKRIRRHVTWMVAGISFFSWAFVFGSALLLSHKTLFLATLPRNQLLAVCNLLGVLALARSPASAISVIHEVKGSGPYCSLVMAIVIVKDVLVFLLFSLALNAAEQASMATKPANSLVNMLYPLCSVASSLALGTVGGILFQKIQSRSILSSSNSSTPTHSQLHTFFRGLMPLVVSSTVYYISNKLQAEPLLACVAAGAASTFIGSSSTPSSSSHQYQADQTKLHASPSPLPRLQRQGSISLGIATTAPGEETTPSHQQQQQHQQMMTMFLVPVSAVLFGLVGANLHVDKLLGNVHIAALLFSVRLVGIWIGSWVGGVFGSCPAPLRQRVPFGMITQAGIAMGLTRIVVARCKICPWGPDFEALMAAIIVGNLILGPLLFKSAIVAAGEATATGNLISISSSLGAGTTAAGPAVMLTPIKSHLMEQGFVTPVKPERSHKQYDGVTPQFEKVPSSGTGSFLPKASAGSFVPIINIDSSSSPPAKMALY